MITAEMMLGFQMKINKTMKMVNGNKKKRLVFAHQNLQGGDVSTNDDDNGRTVRVDQIIMHHAPDVLGISETKASDIAKSVKPGYTWEVKEDSPRILVLVNSALNYRRRKDLETANFPAIWVELSPESQKPILVCQAYREWGQAIPGSKKVVPGSKLAREQLNR